MTAETPPAMRTYCAIGAPTCLRAWFHSGACLPGCRVCHTTDHLTITCPTRTGDTEMSDDDADQRALRAPLLPPAFPPLSPYIYRPPQCRDGSCGHAPGQCVYFRSRRCLSGECRHASQNLMCGTSNP